MSDHTSVFEQEWWYQAATDGKWQHVDYDNGRNLTARLIFTEQKRRGLTTIGMPNLARVMQPTIQFGPNPPKDITSKSVTALRSLSDLLPRFDVFSCTLPPESNLALAFCLAGFAVTANYTFRSLSHGDSHDLWREIDKKVRYNIKTGSKRMTVETHDDIFRYVRLSNRFIRKRAFNDRIDYDAILRIWDACHARKQASVISCVDARGRDIASAILIWDDKHLYYWLSCRDPDLNDPAANSVLMWNAIEYAREACLIFDADGYATSNGGVFLSRFGLVPRQRFDVSLTTSKARLKTAVSSHLVELMGPGIRSQLLALRNVISPARDDRLRQGAILNTYPLSCIEEQISDWDPPERNGARMVRQDTLRPDPADPARSSLPLPD